jgi:hypothetical protein
MRMDEAPRGTPVGRRVFLGLVTLGAATVAAGGPLSRALGVVQREAAKVDPTGLSALIPGGGWRYFTVTGGFPSAPPGLRIEVTGLVRRELSLAPADLATRPRTHLVRDFQCVTGWRVPKVRWAGVRLSDLLDEAGVLPGATAVELVSFDGRYTESLTLAQARRPDVLVADTFEGGPVPREHGGPVRVVVAPMYGYKSLKWLSEIRLTETLRSGYWERYGYDQDGWVGTSNGRDDAPT